MGLVKGVAAVRPVFAALNLARSGFFSSLNTRRMNIRDSLQEVYSCFAETPLIVDDAGVVNLNSSVVLLLAQGHKSVGYIVCGFFEIIAPFEVRTIVFQWADFQFCCEPIVLCEEESERWVDIPPVIHDGIEQHEGLRHTIGRFIFEQQLVVAGDIDSEQNGARVFRTMDPFFALTPYTTDVKHNNFLPRCIKSSLCNTSSLDSGPKYVLICGNIG